LKVFLDTNVLVSAVATRGLSSDVFRLVLDKHEFVTGEPVLQELEQVLAEKLKLPAADVRRILRFLRRFPVEPMPGEPAEVAMTDSDDAWILEAAIRAGAEVLITGDRGFLAIAEQLEFPKILGPRAFWDLHRAAGI
jgi:uncharacterized protein